MTVPEKRAVGVRLREFRTRLDKSQGEFAEVAKCTSAFISMVERGLSAPSAGIIAAVERLGYSSEYLMSGTGKPLRPTDTPYPTNPSDSASFLTRDSSSSVLHPPSSVLSALPPSSILLLLSSSEPLTAGDVLLIRIEKPSTSVKGMMPATILNLIPHRK